MKKKLKPRLGGRGKCGVLQNFLSTAYDGREDFSILKNIAFGGGYPEPIRFLAKVKLSQIQLGRAKL